MLDVLISISGLKFNMNVLVARSFSRSIATARRIGSRISCYNAYISSLRPCRNLLTYPCTDSLKLCRVLCSLSRAPFEVMLLDTNFLRFSNKAPYVSITECLMLLSASPTMRLVRINFNKARFSLHSDLASLTRLMNPSTPMSS